MAGRGGEPGWSDRERADAPDLHPRRPSGPRARRQAETAQANQHHDRGGLRPGRRGDSPAKRNEDLQQLGSHVLLGPFARPCGARRPPGERESPGAREPASAVTPNYPGSTVEAGPESVHRPAEGPVNDAGTKAKATRLVA